MKAVALSLENSTDTLCLPVVLNGFNWEHRGKILDSKSTLNFIKHQLVPNVLQRYLGCAHKFFCIAVLHPFGFMPHGKCGQSANCSWLRTAFPGPLIDLCEFEKPCIGTPAPPPKWNKNKQSNKKTLPKKTGTLSC